MGMPCRGTALSRSTGWLLWEVPTRHLQRQASAPNPVRTCSTSQLQKQSSPFPVVSSLAGTKNPWFRALAGRSDEEGVQDMACAGSEPCGSDKGDPYMGDGQRSRQLPSGSGICHGASLRVPCQFLLMHRGMLWLCPLSWSSAWSRQKFPLYSRITSACDCSYHRCFWESIIFSPLPCGCLTLAHAVLCYQ